MVPKSSQISTKKKPFSQKGIMRKDVLRKPAFVCLLFLAIHAFFVFGSPSHSTSYSIFVRTWGFNNISYYSLPWILLFYALAIAICVPVINQRLNEILERAMGSKLFQILRSNYFLKRFAFICLGIISIGVFRFYQIKYNFLGDLDIRVQQTVKQEFVETEAITMYVMYHIYSVLNSLAGLTGLQTFQWVSYFSGGTFIILSLLLADTLVQGPMQKALFFLFYISFGTMQMFFGYAEIYCLPAVSVLLYLYISILYIKSRVPIVMPVVALLVSIGLHLLSVALLPSLIVLIFYRRFERWMVRRKITIFHFIVLLLAGVPILYIIAPKLGVDYFLVPFVNPDSGAKLMTLFSSEHLWEFFNSQMLAAGTGFFLFLFLLLISLWRKMKYDLTMWFFATSGLGMLYLSFLTNAVRGSGDWDILAFPSIAYNLFGIYTVLSVQWPKLEALRFQYLLPIFLFFNLMNAAAWIGINASDRSITKIEHMIIGDPGNLYQQLHNESNLGIIYEWNGLIDKMVEFSKRAYEHYPEDIRTHYNYAEELIKANQKEMGIKILENLTIIAPQYYNAYKDLLSIYQERNSGRDLFRITERLFNAYVKNPDIFNSRTEINLKQCFTSLRDTEKSIGNNRNVEIISRVLSQLK